MDMTSAAEARSWYDNQQRLGASPGTSAAVLGHQSAAVAAAAAVMDPSDLNPFYPMENGSHHHHHHHRRYYPSSYGPHGMYELHDPGRCEYSPCRHTSSNYPIIQLNFVLSTGTCHP